MKLILFLIGHHQFGWQLNHPIIIIKNKLNAMELWTEESVNEKNELVNIFQLIRLSHLKQWNDNHWYSSWNKQRIFRVKIICQGEKNRKFWFNVRVFYGILGTKWAIHHLHD